LARSGDLPAAAGDRLADGGGGLHVVVEHDGQVAAHVGARDLAEQLGAARVEHEVDRHALGGGPGADARVGEDVAGHERAPLDEVRPPAPGVSLPVEHLHARSGVLGRPGLRPGRHELELEERRLADQLLGALRILDAGQLDDDLVRALRLHRRFGDAELVDAVADDLERLVDDVVADALRLALIEGEGEVGFGVLAR